MSFWRIFVSEQNISTQKLYSYKENALYLCLALCIFHE